jgi:hypothetical protein
MNGKLSANSLFHFTRSKENLISILSSCFQPHYSLEENFFLKRGSNHKWAIPMVSFCDIPLSQIANHITNYGKYAIGLTKEWGKQSGISPILYTHPDSFLTDSFQEMYKSIYSELEENPNANRISNIWDRYLYTAFFIKPYEGKVSINNQKKLIRFYDEREWRYIPSMESIKSITKSNGFSPFLSSGEFEDKNILNRSNLELANSHGLKFHPKNIKYIIVSKESEILDIMDDVLAIKGDFYSYNELKLLSTRIISVEQIVEDF